jgi:hypothetical protein|tara:strand:- start:536 stop:1501 length:966 start_codon:yes stop_codon:yes gene_type:complete
MKNYNFFQKLLHKLCLGNFFLKKTLFEIEKISFKKKIADFSNNNHIFITSLPRSGTTILLLFFYKSRRYASLIYRDMPFLMAPNFFSRIKIKNNIEKKLRAHDDGIYYDLNSPEAFDEVFYNTFKNDEIKENLKMYINLILHKNKKNLYISKNNNNYKRIELINSAFPNSKIIIPFRNPIQHAYSLLNQHKRFCILQKKNKFILEYMNLLGHYEFGLEHKSWNKSTNYNNFDDLNYWLEQWYIFFSNLSLNYKANQSVIFLSYEKFNDKKYLEEKILNKIHGFPEFEFTFINSIKKINLDFDKALLKNCSELYNQLEYSNV